MIKKTNLGTKMAELDYQTALLLQHKYEQEDLSKINLEKTDKQLARMLQEQYEREDYIEKAAVRAPNLIYDITKNKNTDSTKSLIDPSWELVDPTPDIHQLFVIFDKQFFWNSLGSVCVSWSKRMTSCAGICSYRGAGGMCSITLSEPLLKLRPRKDLIETLLHEMIHAYLFVTANNRDRDGHGPEFHKHMYRINKETGTNITVYHSFHDEVRLYKQHWWRCNGPCQSRPPYFGMVKRAMNRAPGPNDRWWFQHLNNCGGSFIKVKEPEKNTKKEITSNRKSVEKVLPDIRKFLTVDNNSASTSSSSVMIKNSDNCSKELLSVRQHWQQKFNDCEFNKKRPLNCSDVGGKQIKITKIESIAIKFVNCPVCNEELLITDFDNHLDMCLKKTNENTDIIDLTTNDSGPSNSKDIQKQCPLCKLFLRDVDFDVHVEQCLTKAYDGVEKKLEDFIRNNQIETVHCLACNKKIIKTRLREHLERCVSDIFDKKTTVDNDNDNNRKYNCPYCWELIESNLMKTHIDNCLQNDFIKSEFSKDF